MPASVARISPLTSSQGCSSRTSAAKAPAVACDMPTYVARIERDGKTLLERVDVTVEMVEEGRWPGRFVLPAGTRLPRQTELGLAFADGRRGRAHVDHRAKPVCSPIAG